MAMAAGSMTTRYFSADPKHTAVFWGLLLLLSGCATQGSSTDEGGASESAAQTKVTHAPLAAVQVGNVAVPSGESVALRRAGSDYEIEIQSPQGFPVRAFDPVLRIGASEFHKFRQSPTAGEFGVVFTVPSSDFDALGNGNAISVGYGPSTRGARAFGNLDKSAVQ